jgi:hypothetical protein
MNNHRLSHVVSGQDPDAMYKWYEVYVYWPIWPIKKLVDCGWVLDIDVMWKNKEVQKQCKAIEEIFNGKE